MSIDDQSPDSNAIFNQDPAPLEQHPVNYLVYLGGLLRRYRRGIEQKDLRSASGFGERLGEYLGKPVGRRTISRVEKGDHTVNWGVIASYLCEMEAWPDVISALEHSDTNNLRYLILIEKETSEEIDESKKAGVRVLRSRKLKENNRVEYE